MNRHEAKQRLLDLERRYPKGRVPDEPIIRGHGRYNPLRFRCICNARFDDEIPGWEIVDGPKFDKNGPMWVTVYQSEYEHCQTFIDAIRRDKRRSGIVDRMIAENAPIMDSGSEEYQRRRAEEKRSNMNRRTKVTVSKSGRLTATKYEYPPDCVSKHDRSVYRRKMRAQRRKGNG